MFLVVLSLLITGVIFIYPKDGMNISNHKINFFSIEEFYINKKKLKIPHLNIDSLINIQKREQDSLNELEEKIRIQILDSITRAHKRILYPNNNLSVLYPFFDKLTKAKQKKVRVMHYGDSQIEADRISGRLRERLQREFGGYGPGVFAVIPATNKISINTILSSNWVRKTGFGPYIDTSVHHKRYGALFSFCSINKDTSLNNVDSLFNGSIKIVKPTRSYKHCRNYQTVSIYYTAEEIGLFKALLSDSVFFEDTIYTTEKLKKISFSLNKAPDILELEISSLKSPLIYGISLEGRKGVLVDNIPLRGASGTEFARISYSSLSQMYNLLSPDMFILEFGGNTIPYLKTTEKCINYGKYFKKQILKIKKQNPGAIVLVIGPADMAKKDKTSLVTYPNLERVIDELKKAAFETNSCFWDTYLNMGGENSIQEWTLETPPLAARDYIHFTRAGARKIADFFIEDLMEDFEQYLLTKDE